MLFNIFSRKRRKKKKAYTRREGPKLSSSGKSGKRAISRSEVSERAKSRRRSRLRALFMRLLSIGFTLLILGMLVVAYLAADLPSINSLDQFKKAPSITVKTQDGQVLANYGEVFGDYIPYDQFPKPLVNAVLATEDRNFFFHPGVDPKGILRAIWVNTAKGRVVQGGSTITQQVAKNVFLTPERTITRKAKELLLALWLEMKYSKEEILSIYLNRVYLGAGNFGIDAACRRYFDKPVQQIGLAESAILAGLLKAPSRFAPTSNPTLAQQRGEQVLVNMVDAGFLTTEEAEITKSAIAEVLKEHVGSGQGSRYFTDWIVDQLPEYVGNIEQDLVVTATLDPQMQKLAEEAITKVMDAESEKVNVSQAALLAMDSEGAVRAMVGGRDYGKSQYNRATQSHRQPGSLFKLFVYLAAIEAGYMPDSRVVDEPISVGRWTPKNYDGKYRGEITLREALAHSINTVAVQLSEAVGREKVVDMAHRLGITSDLNPDPSIALGSNEATLYELVTAFDHLAAGGKAVFPHGIQEIRTSKGDLIYGRITTGTSQILSSNVVAMINQMLIGVVTSGTGTGANIGRPIAGKTGTTSDYRDAWFVGFTPQLATGVWVGNDDNKEMKKVTGGNLPASIWREFMSKAMEGKPVQGIPSEITIDTTNTSLPWLNNTNPDGGLTGPTMNTPLPTQNDQPVQDEAPDAPINTQSDEGALRPVNQPEVIHRPAPNVVAPQQPPAPVITPAQPVQPAQQPPVQILTPKPREEEKEILTEGFWQKLGVEKPQAEKR